MFFSRTGERLAWVIFTFSQFWGVYTDKANGEFFIKVIHINGVAIYDAEDKVHCEYAVDLFILIGGRGNKCEQLNFL